MRGVRALRHVLREQTLDLRQLDLAGFRRWLGEQLARWQRDPVFVQRTRIRDLRRGQPALRQLEKEYRRAAALDAASEPFARLQELERQLTDTDKAIVGLSAALPKAAAERQPGLQQKLHAFQDRRQALHEEQAQLIAASAPRQAVLRVRTELQQLRASIGLEREEERLEQLLRQQGRRSGQAGGAFEQQAEALTESHILPDLRRRMASSAARPLRVLRGVTLGAARVEFDQLVVREPPRPGEPVEVLAAVEVKRNINDLGHGFRLRQGNLAWLTHQADQVDPRLYRTAHFRTGHFDREAVHEHGGEQFHFGPRSFRRFRRDRTAGLFLDRLYFITRAGPVWGLATAALSRVSYRVATDERWQPDSDEYLGKLLHWCGSLAEPVEAPEVLQTYGTAPGRARQVLLVGP